MKSIVFALSAFLLGGCVSSTGDIPAVTDFNPEKYMGKWYEIARLPQWFERDMDYVSASYSLNENGTVKVVNTGVKKGKTKAAAGVARLKDPERLPLTGELEVSFFRPFYSGYRIIELAPDYSYAVVTGAKRDALWILARKPVMDKAVLHEIIGKLKLQGFETERLEYPRQ